MSKERAKAAEALWVEKSESDEKPLGIGPFPRKVNDGWRWQTQIGVVSESEPCKKSSKTIIGLDRLGGTSCMKIGDLRERRMVLALRGPSRSGKRVARSHWMIGCCVRNAKKYRGVEKYLPSPPPDLSAGHNPILVAYLE
jgi:hypothetical protein